MGKMDFVIITGLAGAGKTSAMQCFEDQGFFCVDNLPANLIPKFAELCVQSEGKISQVAVVVDIRSRGFFSDIYSAIEMLKEMGINCRIIFLEASDDALVRRYKETRRRHPLAQNGRILDGINSERKLLENLRGMANKIIDTTNISPRQLKDEIVAAFTGRTEEGQMLVTVISFGYKYGIPIDADLVTDVRFLPNPFYEEALRLQTGENEMVRNYVLQNETTKEFMKKFLSLVEFLLPNYIREGKTHLTIAIGCTGGKHRSVTIAKEVRDRIKEKGYYVHLEHRDINRDSLGE
jgi:UPF0042 nucleotide-binding protein